MQTAPDEHSRGSFKRWTEDDDLHRRLEHPLQAPARVITVRAPSRCVKILKNLLIAGLQVGWLGSQRLYTGDRHVAIQVKVWLLARWHAAVDGGLSGL